MNTPDPHPHSLPIDSDLDVDQIAPKRPRPVHLHVRYLAVVALGGAIGTAGRELLTMTIPPLGVFPIATFGINILGALLLGVLLEALARGGADDGVWRVLRLLLGTGLMGGFTTYSALATDTILLAGGGHYGMGILYAACTVLVGALATWGGIAGAATLHRTRKASMAEGTTP